MPVSVVVPVYNSEGTLKALVERLLAVLGTVAPGSEIVLVDDGSRDGSGAAIERLSRERPEVVAIRLMRNYGQHNALLCGIRAARHDVVVTLDDDLQNPPEEIPRLLAELDRGKDVVYGSAPGQHGLWRTLASGVLRLTLKGAMGVESARHVSPFRAFRTRLRDAFADYRSPFVSIDVLLTWGTTRFGFVPVRQDPRAVGRSNYTLGRLVRLALDMATGFSTLPLRLASWVGFAFTLFGVAVLGYVLYWYLRVGYSVPGFPFLASIISIFAGAQLLAIGLIGEYLSRMHFRTMDRPAYVVRDRSSGGKAS
jgi:undecaprenyl-phosphate 4-deoxy-4-formamido-L-arabinose transferase